MFVSGLGLATLRSGTIPPALRRDEISISRFSSITNPDEQATKGPNEFARPAISGVDMFAEFIAVAIEVAHVTVQFPNKPSSSHALAQEEQGRIDVGCVDPLGHRLAGDFSGHGMVSVSQSAQKKYGGRCKITDPTPHGGSAR